MNNLSCFNRVFEAKNNKELTNALKESYDAISEASVNAPGTARPVIISPETSKVIHEAIEHARSNVVPSHIVADVEAYASYLSSSGHREIFIPSGYIVSVIFEEHHLYPADLNRDPVVVVHTSFRVNELPSVSDLKNPNSANKHVIGAELVKDFISLILPWSSNSHSASSAYMCCAGGTLDPLSIEVYTVADKEALEELQAYYNSENNIPVDFYERSFSNKSSLL